MYWAEALAGQSKDGELSKRFKHVVQKLKENEAKINEELIASQGSPQDIKGYYWPDRDLVFKYMRPSETLNSIIELV
jgi:isocitrate dehydrogenase